MGGAIAPPALPVPTPMEIHNHVASLSNSYGKKLAQYFLLYTREYRALTAIYCGGFFDFPFCDENGYINFLENFTEIYILLVWRLPAIGINLQSSLIDDYVANYAGARTTAGPSP